MNKKLLLGSILAVVLLVLVSFTGVVGFQSVKSDSAINSPLFNVRSKRAIDKESKNTLTTNYIGKQNKVVIPFLIPTRATMIKTIIERIKEIDDSAFNQLLLYVIYASDTDFTESGKLPPEIVEVIQIIREETDNIVAQDNPEPLTSACQTLDCQTAIRCSTVFGGCITYNIFTALIRILNNVYVVTESIPLFKGNMVLLLIEVLASLYEMYTTTLPTPTTALQTD